MLRAIAAFLLICICLTSTCATVGVSVSSGNLSFDTHAGMGTSKLLIVNNSGSDTANYRVYVDDDYVDWFELSPHNFTLRSGENKNVNITVNPPLFARGDSDMKIYVVATTSDSDIGSGIRIPVHVHVSNTVFIWGGIILILLGSMVVYQKKSGKIIPHLIQNLPVYLKPDKKELLVSDTHTSGVRIEGKAEIFQSFVLLSISIKNNNSSQITDVHVYLDFDKKVLKIHKCYPDSLQRNGAFCVRNINKNSSQTIRVYFDPLICSKDVRIKCHLTYKDDNGNLNEREMEPILISGTCHILQTDSDINVAEFYKLLDSLGFEDSKTYHLHTNIDVKIMKNITEEIMQEYNAKHVLTLYAGGNSDCEIWYYGKTKINKEDVIMKIDISPAEHTIKLFVTTRSIDTLVRILSEIGGKLQDGLECIGN